MNESLAIFHHPPHRPPARWGKVAHGSMCQLAERLMEYKFKGSYEQIAKAIKKYSAVPQLDLVNFWELVVFSWITGNADMHLKNSIIPDWVTASRRLTTCSPRPSSCPRTVQVSS